MKRARLAQSEVGALPHEQTRAFLEALFAGKSEDQYLLLWTLHEKRSHWFRSIEEAVCLAGQSNARDLYVGVGLANQSYGPNRRCPSNEVAGLVGLWADIDLRSDAHPRESLPGTIDEALSILPPEMPPSFLISTGNGLHGWWLLKEPYVFESEEQRSRGAGLVLRWHTLLRDNANLRGWTYERLADLARVLRVPGTTNCKDPASPKPVVILSRGNHRYNPSEMAEYLEDLGVPDQDEETRKRQRWAECFRSKPLTIDLAARIPQDRLEAWLATDERFKRTWFRQRQDLVDQTQSGYDIALACFGVSVGCTEQEIIDLITQHRAIHKAAPRTRLDYFQRTLAKAANRAENTLLKQTSARDKVPAVGAAAEMLPASSADSQSAGAASGRAKIALCRDLSSALGVEIIRLVKLTGKDPLYRMELAAGKVEFQNVGEFISKECVRRMIAAAVGKLIPRFTGKPWDQIAQTMLDACLEEDGGEELQYEGAARLQIERYLQATTFISSFDGQVRDSLLRPMVRGGRITVSASDLQSYVTRTTMPNYSVRAAAATLSAVGATQLRVRDSGIKEQSRWELPVNKFHPADYKVEFGNEGSDDRP
jgi:hypothetical protein